MGFLANKRILITGMISNRSIAYGAAQAMHREGAPLARRRQDRPVAGAAPGQELFRPSLALFDVRRREHIPAAQLPLPAMLDKERPVKISRDPRQGLEVRKVYLSDPAPAATSVEIKSLAFPDLLIEIEVVAVKPS